LTGREKSAVIACINYKLDKHSWRMIFFHEFMHIYCGKTEVDGEHFIDTYGSGHTPDENPDNKIYDGIINAGYEFWSEFIAQYYALIKIERAYTFNQAANYILNLFGDVTVRNFLQNKRIFPQAGAGLISCRD